MINNIIKHYIMPQFRENMKKIIKREMKKRKRMLLMI